MRRVRSVLMIVTLLTLSLAVMSSSNTFNTIESKYAIPELVLVKAGSFYMGDEVGDLWPETRPVHTVTLTYDFMIGKYEVTFEQYDDYALATGSRQAYDQGWGIENMPVINVDWREATRYCNWLSERDGLRPAYNQNGELLDKKGSVTTDITKVEGYRLPTEAEWEYAASGGHKALPNRPLYAGSDDVDEVAWYSDNSGEYILDTSLGHFDYTNHGAAHIKGMSAQAVGKKEPNELGLHDMSGNVWEWCHDWYGEYTSEDKTNPIGDALGHVRVMRGGAWIFGPQDCRVANRFYRSAHDRLPRLGFRVARTVVK